MEQVHGFATVSRNIRQSSIELDEKGNCSVELIGVSVFKAKSWKVCDDGRDEYFGYVSLERSVLIH